MSTTALQRIEQELDGIHFSPSRTDEAKIDMLRHAARLAEARAVQIENKTDNKTGRMRAPA